MSNQSLHCTVSYYLLFASRLGTYPPKTTILFDFLASDNGYFTILYLSTTMRLCLVRLFVAVTCLLQACTSLVAVPTVPTSIPVGSSISKRSPWHRHGRHEHATTTPRTAGSKIRQALEFQMSNRSYHHEEEDTVTAATQRRRHFLRDFFMASASATTSAAIVGGSSCCSSLSVANAAIKSSQTTFEVGKDLTVDEAKTRFKEGQESLDYLLGHYDEICEGGGDNVRRYLGTVGTTSGLYGIAKVMKMMQPEADDIVEYTEMMNEINASLVGADGSAYMAIFTGSSTSGVPKEKYYDDAKIDVKRAIGSMQEIAKQLSIR